MALVITDPDFWFECLDEFIDRDFEENAEFMEDEYFGNILILTISEVAVNEKDFSNYQYKARYSPSEFNKLETWLSKTQIENQAKPYPSKDEILVLLYTETWDFVSGFSKRRDQIED